MNAVFSLCHFCELHGPRIVFCTQTFRSSSNFIFHGPENTCTTAAVLQTRHINKENKGTWKYGTIDSDKEQFLRSQPSSVTDTCSACQSYPHYHAAVVSNDDEFEVSYVSSQYPLQEEIFTLTRLASIRSLSCEVYSESEGPIYFGDDARGHILSYAFFLRDLQARGFQRRYSILVLMRDKMFLLNSWSFFVKYIEEIIQCLQEYANKVYLIEEDRANTVRGLKASSVTDSTIKRHRSVGNPRPLTELTGERGIWRELHTKFTWILKAGSMRLQEKMVEGPPFIVPSLEQGSITPKSFLSLTGPTLLQKILHYIYIGKKVVLCSADNTFLSDVALFLKSLIPSYLYHHHHVTSNNWDTIKDANVLTCGIVATFPENLQLLAVTFKNCCGQEIETDAGRHRAETVPCMSIAEDYEVCPLKAKPPQIVVKISKLFENRNISDAVFRLNVATLIDEWNNKVQIWSYVSKNKANLNPRQNLVPSCCPSHSNTVDAKKLTNSQTSGMSGVNSSNFGYCSSLLLVVGALDCDVQMLEALTEYYENYRLAILSTN